MVLHFLFCADACNLNRTEYARKIRDSFNKCINANNMYWMNNTTIQYKKSWYIFVLFLYVRLFECFSLLYISLNHFWSIVFKIKMTVLYSYNASLKYLYSKFSKLFQRICNKCYRLIQIRN